MNNYLYAIVIMKDKYTFDCLYGFYKDYKKAEEIIEILKKEDEQQHEYYEYKIRGAQFYE